MAHIKDPCDFTVYTTFSLQKITVAVLYGVKLWYHDMECSSFLYTMAFRILQNALMF